MYFVLSYRSGIWLGSCTISLFYTQCTMENGSAFAWASLLVWVFFQPNQQLLSLISSLLKEQQCRRIQKEHLRVESFFQRKNISFYVSECHESQRTVLMVARHCHGWQCHTWLRAWWIPAALEIPQSLSHTHPSTLQDVGLGATQSAMSTCLLHLCFASWLILLFVLLLLATWHHVWGSGFNFLLLF